MVTLTGSLWSTSMHSSNPEILSEAVLWDWLVSGTQLLARVRLLQLYMKLLSAHGKSRCIKRFLIRHHVHLYYKVPSRCFLSTHCRLIVVCVAHVLWHCLQQRYLRRRFTPFPVASSLAGLKLVKMSPASISSLSSTPSVPTLPSTVSLRTLLVKLKHLDLTDEIRGDRTVVACGSSFDVLCGYSETHGKVAIRKLRVILQNNPDFTTVNYS